MAPNPPASETPIILVVDDSPEISLVIEAILTEAGYRVATAPDGRVGLELTVALGPQIVLLDMMMPEVDGLEYLERIASLDGRRPAVIAMSGFDLFEPEALKRGARTFLHKPFKSDVALSAIATILRGEAFDPQALARHEEQVGLERKERAAARAQFLRTVDFASPEVEERLVSVVQWCTGYFGVGMAFVNVEKGGKIHFQAAVGGGRTYVEGGQVEREASFCTLVIEASSPMVLGDGSLSSVFRQHPVVAAGFRFYAGVPLKMAGKGIAFGTLCVLDGNPKIFHAEDLDVLESIAGAISRRISAIAGAREPGPFAFVAKQVFTREIFDVLVHAQLRRCQREGACELALVDVGENVHAHYETCAQAIYSAAGRFQTAVGEESRGVLGIVIGGATPNESRTRMNAALASLAREGVEVLGAGVVSLGTNAGRTDRAVAQSLAEEALSRALTGTKPGAVERVVLGMTQEPAAIHP